MQREQATTGDIEAMAARLRQSIIAENEALTRQGRSDGLDWALKHASERELRGLDAAEEEWIITEGHSLCPDMYEAVEDEHHLGSNQQGVWTADLTDAYWRGFTEAALEAYRAARPLI